MCERLDELGDAEVAVVHFDQIERLADYRRWFDVPDRVALLADPDRTVYDALGIGRGDWWRVWGPRTYVAYAQLILRHGRRYRRHRGDSLQLGADAVIGPDGRLATLFRPDQPDARPTVDEIVAAVSAAGPEG